MARAIKIYTTSNCPYCAQAKQYLTSKGIEFENLDVTTDENARQEMIDKSGQMGVPVIMVDEQMVVGFDRAKISKALN